MSLSKSDLEDIRNVVHEELSSTDLGNIRNIVREEVRSEVGAQLIPVNNGLDSIDGRLEATENDVKDIYFMISDMQNDIKGLRADTGFIAGRLHLTLPSPGQ